MRDDIQTHTLGRLLLSDTSWRKATLEAGGSVKRLLRATEARTEKGQMMLGCYSDGEGEGVGRSEEQSVR